jgi:hypothetical protein
MGRSRSARACEAETSNRIRLGDRRELLATLRRPGRHEGKKEGLTSEDRKLSKLPRENRDLRWERDPHAGGDDFRQGERALK